MNILIDTVSCVVVLGVLVFLHELGHFLCAKLFRVRVETFSLGFGTRLMGFRKGDTDYRLSALPFGGYVKMAGELPGELAAQAVIRPGDLASKPRWQRLIIAFAGPAMNIALAVALLVPIYMREFPRNSFLDQPAIVAAVQPNSPASAAGMRPGDRVVAADGIADPTWEQLINRAALSAAHSLPLTVARGGHLLHVTVIPSTDEQDVALGLGVTPREPATIASITPGSPAQKAGLRANDRLLAVDGQPLVSLEDFSNTEQASGGRPLTLTVARGKRQLTLRVAPLWTAAQGQTKWMIGTELTEGTEMVPLPFGQALHESLSENRLYSALIIELVGRLVTRQASLKVMQSPVGIASITGEAARQPTLAPLAGITSLISLNLGILNLLPIPILDGGTILFLLVESLLRHDVSLQVKERIYQAGFAFLVLLMTFVVYNDIVRAVTRR